MLWLWVIVLVVLVGAIAVVAAGRGDSLSEVYDDRPDAVLPAGRPLTADDLRDVRLNTGVRGYRMDEVDALLSRLEADLIERERGAGESSVPEVTDDQPEPDGVAADARMDEPVQRAPVTEQSGSSGAEPVEPVEHESGSSPRDFP